MNFTRCEPTEESTTGAAQSVRVSREVRPAAGRGGAYRRDRLKCQRARASRIAHLAHLAVHTARTSTPLRSIARPQRPPREHALGASENAPRCWGRFRYRPSHGRLGLHGRGRWRRAGWRCQGRRDVHDTITCAAKNAHLARTEPGAVSMHAAIDVDEPSFAAADARRCSTR